MWEDIHPDSQEFIKEYLKQYPEVSNSGSGTWTQLTAFPGNRAGQGFLGMGGMCVDGGVCVWMGCEGGGRGLCVWMGCEGGGGGVWSYICVGWMWV